MSLNNSQKRSGDCANYSYSWDTFVKDRVQDLWVFTSKPERRMLAWPLPIIYHSFFICMRHVVVKRQHCGCVWMHACIPRLIIWNRPMRIATRRRWQQLHMVLAPCSHRAHRLSITHGTNYKRWYQRLESIVILCAFTEDGSQVVQTLFQICIHIRRTLLYRPPFLAT